MFSEQPCYSTEMLKGDWNSRIQLRSPGSVSHCQLLPLCINYFLCLFDNISDMNNLKNGWFVLAISHRQFSPELFDPMYLRNLLIITRTPTISRTSRKSNAIWRPSVPHMSLRQTVHVLTTTLSKPQLSHQLNGDKGILNTSDHLCGGQTW